MGELSPSPPLSSCVLSLVTSTKSFLVNWVGVWWIPTSPCPGVLCPCQGLGPALEPWDPGVHEMYSWYPGILVLVY